MAEKKIEDSTHRTGIEESATSNRYELDSLLGEVRRSKGKCMEATLTYTAEEVAVPSDAGWMSKWVYNCAANNSERK